MTTTEAQGGDTSEATTVDMKLEVVTIPVSYVDQDLVSRGVDVREVFHLAGGRVRGPDPEGRSYQTYASFSDPDGNEWQLQEINARLPGREWED